ncbi:MAG: ECF transporter S component [Lachnospiraceae bacterium]|nr:ECF transporter S component [Lachnospiraceae bacterium]
MSTEVLKAGNMGVNEKAQKNTAYRVRVIASVGMLSAIAAVLMMFEFPLVFIAPSFYKLDFSEVPVLIGAFAFGPIAGIVIEFVKICLKLVMKGTFTFGVGELGNFLIGCSLVVPASVIYSINKTRKGAVIGLITGTVVITIAGVLLNAYLLLPFYAQFMGGIDALVAIGTGMHSAINSPLTFALLLVAPFNLVKGVLVSLITMLLYKRISRLIKGAGA